MPELDLRLQVGKYDVQKLLGKGSTGTVYLAKDTFTGREVALKTLEPEVFRDPKFGEVYRAQFLNEASLAGKLRHPHIVAILDAVVGEESGHIAMELVTGGDLSAHAKPVARTNPFAGDYAWGRSELIEYKSDRGERLQGALEEKLNLLTLHDRVQTPLYFRLDDVPDRMLRVDFPAKRVDVAHETGFSLVNPLSVKKQIEGQITWFYNDAMHQMNTIKDGRIVENNFNAFKLSRIDEDPPEINIRFFKTAHWLLGMGHDRATSVQSAIGDAIFQITGKRLRDLPYGGHDLSWS